MSDFAQKHYRSLMEAYASIYNKPEQTTQEQLEEEICFEDLEVDNDLVVDLVVDRLIVEGYANTDDQALNMIPHMSDAWLDTVVGNFVIEQNFIESVNSILEEGYDLSSYTVDELYGEYIRHFNNYLNEDYRTDLHEVVPLLAAPLLTNPATLAAGAGLAAGAAYAGKKAYDAYRQMKTGTDPASQRWLETGSYASTKDKPTQKPAQDQRRVQQAKERLLQRQQAAAQPPATAQPASAGGASAGGAPPTPPSGGGKPPKPRIDPLQTVKDLFKAGKQFVERGKGPVSQVLGKPARERFFGTTRAGQITRGAAATGVSALDIGGKILDPSNPSLVAKLGSVGPGAVGTAVQGLGNIPGLRGTSFGTGARAFGGAARQVGREMRDQPSQQGIDAERARIEKLFPKK